jgi:glycosyltransferase involved in cell wall biosynthesis
VKISYVNGICLRNDAISNAIRDEVGWASAAHDVKLYTYACDDPAMPSVIVSDCRDILFDDHFQASDLVVFHFGVFYPLFNIMTATPQRAKRVVVFHNITPKQFVPAANHHLIDSSFTQLSNLKWAHYIICVSKTNLDVLRNNGIHNAACILPLALHSEVQAPPAKPSFQDEVVRLIFVGRFVRSKGPTELLHALAQLMLARPALHVQLDMIGSLTFSDQQILAEIGDAIAALHLRFGARLKIVLQGNAPEQEKNQRLADADIMVLPSYHEGFCVPILEALASGCQIVSYDNSNIPSIAGDFGHLVATGDTAALAAAVLEVADAVGAPAWRDDGAAGYADFASRASAYVSQFAPASIRYRYLTLLRRLTPFIAGNK